MKNIELRRFEWDSEYMPDVNDKKVIGFIAQELKSLQEETGTEYLKLVYESNRILILSAIRRKQRGENPTTGEADDENIRVEHFARSCVCTPCKCCSTGSSNTR